MKAVYIITQNSMGEVWINGREHSEYKYKPHLALQVYLNIEGAELLCSTQSSPEHGTVTKWTVVINKNLSVDESEL